MRTAHFMYFVLRNTSGPRVKFVYSYHPPPHTHIVYATDRSKAVVRVLFLFRVVLWIILRGAACFKLFPCSLSSCYIIPFSIVVTWIWSVYFSCICLFVLYVSVFVIFIFLLVSGIGCSL